MTISLGYDLSGISIGPQDQADPGSDEINVTLTPGAITAAGQDVLLGVFWDITPGTITVAGSDFTLTITNTTRQLVTVTDVSKIGTEITLFDSLTGVTPEVNDIWHVPTTSTDGGTFTLAGDGTFQIGVPTSGEDTLEAVEYYDVTADQWHGPADITVIDEPLVLTVTPTTQPIFEGRITANLDTVYPTTIGAVAVAGQNIDLAITIEIGTVTVAGQNIDVINNPGLVVTPGTVSVLGLSGQLDSSYPVTPATITFAGQDIVLFQGTKLEVEPSTLTVAGQTQTLTGTLLNTIGSAVFAGVDIVITSDTTTSPWSDLTDDISTWTDQTDSSDTWTDAA